MYWTHSDEMAVLVARWLDGYMSSPFALRVMRDIVLWRTFRDEVDYVPL